MKKQQVVFIHGGEAWGSHEEYIEYLKTTEVRDPQVDTAKRWGRSEYLTESLGEGYEILFLSMPSKKNAKYDEWRIWFERNFQFFDDNVIFIGHSLGANFLAKYLAENRLPVKIRALHLVAGCCGYVAGFDLPSDLSNVEKQAGKIFIYHSRDDPVVPFADAQRYQKLLPNARLVEFSDRGHFLDETFPEIIECIKIDK